MSDIDKNILVSSEHIYQKQYWINKLSGESSETGLVPDYKAKKELEIKMDEVNIEILDKQYYDLMKLSKESDISLYIIMVAAVN